MKVISIRQPWASLIVCGSKDIENRTWATKYRGPIAIHASLKYDQEGASWVLSKFSDASPMALLFGSKMLPKGGIVGYAEIVDCVTESELPWFCGPYGFVLKNARTCEFMPLKGKLGIFEI